MPRPVKSDSCFIDDFYTKYQDAQIRKPRIQRKKRWSTDQSKKYIQFIARLGNTCLPLSVNELQMDGKNIYMLFDGNNRANAILDFYHTPLSLFEDFIPQEFQPIKPHLQSTHLDTLLQKRYTYLKFCEDVHCVPEVCDKCIEEAWERMMDCLEHLNFKKIRVQLNRYDHLTNEEMQHIYESINRGGMPLTEQDLLASSLANQQYSDLPNDITQAVEAYYEDMNQGERLRMCEKLTQLNLYEILTGLQWILHQSYGFIPEPNVSKDLDIVFYLWKQIHGFTQTTKEPVDSFIRNVKSACALLHEVLCRMYDPVLNFQEHHKMKKVNILTCLLYFMYTDVEKKQLIHKALLYHTILMKLYDDKELDPTMRSQDIFWYQHHGLEIHKQIKRKAFKLPEIPDKRIQEELFKLVQKHIHPTKSRKKNHAMEALALTAFYNQQIPSATKLLTHQIDHIVPFSVRNDQVDICRLGNKQLIPESINASRKANPITDKWVTDHKLLYQQYPTGEEYKQIYDGRLHIEPFNAMCERRERIYIDHILTSYTSRTTS